MRNTSSHSSHSMTRWTISTMRHMTTFGSISHRLIAQAVCSQATVSNDAVSNGGRLQCSTQAGSQSSRQRSLLLWANLEWHAHSRMHQYLTGSLSGTMHLQITFVTTSPRDTLHSSIALHHQVLTHSLCLMQMAMLWCVLSLTYCIRAMGCSPDLHGTMLRGNTSMKKRSMQTYSLILFLFILSFSFLRMWSCMLWPLFFTPIHNVSKWFAVTFSKEILWQIIVMGEKRSHFVKIKKKF